MLGRSSSFLVAGIAGAATLAAASAPSPLYPVYERLWNFSAFTLTVVFAVYVFALLAALLTVGSLSDRVGRRPIASGALLLLALGMLLFATADGLGGLLVARIVQGFAVGTAAGTLTAMILDLEPDARWGSIVSSGVSPLGIAVGAVLAGALVQFAPLPRQLVFWLLAAIYLVLAAAVWFVPERARRDPASQGSVWRALRPSAGLPSATRPVFVSLVPALVATWALAGLYLSLGSSVLGAVLGVRSHLVVGIAIAAFFVAGASGTGLSAVLPQRVGERLGQGLLAGGVLITIAALSTDALPAYVLGSVVAGLGFGAAIRSAIAVLGEASPAADRGQVFTTMYIVSYLAFSVPALAAGVATELFGLRATAVAYGALDVLLVLVAAIAGLARGRRGAARPGIAEP